MFDLHCTTCDRTFLMGPRSLRRLENTDDGPVGEAVCPHGHPNRVEFHRQNRSSAPPGAARRQRLAG